MVNKQSPVKPSDSGKGKAPISSTFQPFTPAAAASMSSVKAQFRQVPTPHESVRAKSEATQLEHPDPPQTNFPSTIAEEDLGPPDASSSPKHPDTRDERFDSAVSQVLRDFHRHQQEYETGAGPSGPQRQAHFERPPHTTTSYTQHRIPLERPTRSRMTDDPVFTTPPQQSAPPIESRRDPAYPQGPSRRTSLFDSVPVVSQTKQQKQTLIDKYNLKTKEYKEIVNLKDFKIPINKDQHLEKAEQ
ncbi:Uncharacterized protein LW94_13100 [Fusarium fujikuroi]|nr:Uncharacterized protein LW94_13100 [Fusarium fujikuroi]